jgi:hypothetical protein
MDDSDKDLIGVLSQHLLEEKHFRKAGVPVTLPNTDLEHTCSTTALLRHLFIRQHVSYPKLLTECR